MRIHTTNNSDEEHLQLIRRVQHNLTKKFKVYSGENTDGDEYMSIEEMWISEGVIVPNKTDRNSRGSSSWYTKSHDYWQNNETTVPATIDGMLGGYAALTEKDLIGSRRFVEDLFCVRSQDLNARLLASAAGERNHDGDGEGTIQRKTRCCECGAGIGRVSKGLLLPLGDPDAARCRYFCMGLQDFNPEPDTYDVIWIQWVIGYLTDLDLVQYFRRMALSLRQPDGILVLKDNVCTDGAFIVDRDDSSLTRSLPYLMELVKESGLRVVKQSSGAITGNNGDMIRFQDDFPENIFPVPMIALELDV